MTVVFVCVVYCVLFPLLCTVFCVCCVCCVLCFVFVVCLLCVLCSLFTLSGSVLGSVQLNALCIC